MNLIYIEVEVKGSFSRLDQVLEQITYHLSTRDKLIARQVCLEWQNFIDSCHSTFVEKVLVRVEHSEEPVKFLDQSSLGVIWTSFCFKSVEFTRHSMSFWGNYGDQLTRIDFYDCTFPQNFFAPSSSGEVSMDAWTSCFQSIRKNSV